MMKKSNRKSKGLQVIIHGDSWPVVAAAEALVRAVLPDCKCEATHTLTLLLQYLHRQPQSILLLCLRPREHIFLFYALKDELIINPTMVISDELLFSDRLVLESWGDIPVIQHQELTENITCLRHNDQVIQTKGKLVDFLSAPELSTGCFSVPQMFTTQKRLMNYMSLLMLRALVDCGATSAQLRLLQEIYKGQGSMAELSEKLEEKEKQIWQDKYRLLAKLGMRNRMRELFFGTRFIESIQKTPFTMPEITELYRPCR